MADSIYEKAMRLLGRPVTKAVDPDDADSRVGSEAEPTDKKLEAAGEEAAAGGQAASPDGNEGGVPANPGAEDGEGEGADGSAEHEGGESQGQEGSEQEGGDDDGEDMTPDEVRELRKAFGLTDHDDIADTKKNTEIPALLKSILSYMQKSDAYMQNLTKELADLKAKHASGKADEDLRVTMKSFTDSMNAKFDELRGAMVNLPRTAPAAAGPKGFSKAVNIEQPQQPRLTLNDINTLAMKGEITGLEAARLTRMVNHNQTPA